jgi:uncharacterized protein YodC (DUF2158 family)
MAPESFQLGDRVLLKSAGPVMTVTELSDGQVWCQWFDKQTGIERTAFRAARAHEGG